MSRCEKILGQWTTACPPEVPWADCETVLNHFELKWRRGGKGHIVITDPRLIDPELYRNNNYVFATKSGRYVKRLYIRKLMRALRHMGVIQ